MDIVVAEKNLVTEAPDGSRTPVQVTIGRPYRVAASTWTCPLRVEGLGAVADGLGTDSWHALTVAIGVARQHLAECVRRGSRLLCATDGAELNIDDLFPSF